jgi:hypothetical protein
MILVRILELQGTSKIYLNKKKAMKKVIKAKFLEKKIQTSQYARKQWKNKFHHKRVKVANSDDYSYCIIIRLYLN